MSAFTIFAHERGAAFDLFRQIEADLGQREYRVASRHLSQSNHRWLDDTIATRIPLGFA